MTPKEAEEIRTRNDPKNAAKDKTKERPPPTGTTGPVPPEDETNLPPHVVPVVDPLADNPAQCTSVVGGATGQAWGLPKPVTQKELDEAEAAAEEKPQPKGHAANRSEKSEKGEENKKEGEGDRK